MLPSLIEADNIMQKVKGCESRRQVVTTLHFNSYKIDSLLELNGQGNIITPIRWYEEARSEWLISFRG